MRQLIAALVFAIMAGAPAAAAESVDLELVLLADASRSIDDAEIRFQRQLRRRDHPSRGAGRDRPGL